MNTIRRTPQSAYEIREGRPLPQPMNELYKAVYESRMDYTEIAEKSGVHIETMRKWFALGKTPTLSSYMAVANAVGKEVMLTGQSC